MKDREWLFQVLQTRTTIHSLRWVVDGYAPDATTIFRAFGPTKFAALRNACRRRRTLIVEAVKRKVTS